jgi:ABC transporter substrate binding protein
MKKVCFTFFILAALIFAPVYLAHAQKQATIPRIGVLYLGAPHSNPNFDVFVQGLRELGYIDGKNILIEYRFAEGKEDRLPELATELVRLKVDAALEAKATQKVAGPLGVALQDRGVKDPNELEVVFAVMTKDRPDAFLALMDPVLISYRKRILDFLAKNRLPAIFQSSDWVEAGGLISYGPDYPDMFRRAAALMDKILKGAKPADIPVEQPTKFELAINLKTAKQIGVTIPDSVLFQADKVIR